MMRRSTLTLAFGVLTALALWSAPGRATEATMADLLSGKIVPATVTFKELTPEWVKFNLDAPKVDEKFQMMMAARSDDLGRQSMELMTQLASYYTRGATVTCDSETYLIAYRRIQLDQPFNDENGRMLDFSTISAITPDTPMRLCLLNLKTAGSLFDIRPVESAEELARSARLLAQAQEKARQSESMANLKQLSLVLQMDAQNHEGKFIIVTPDIDLKTALNIPENIAVHPVTHAPYLINPAVSGKPVGMYQQPENTLLVYEASPWSDGSRSIAFVDGHVAKVSKNEWESIKIKWRLP